MIRNDPPELVKITSSHSLEAIASDYNEAFQEGFDVSTEEIGHYLGVSELWITRHLKEGIKYIIINAVARRALAKYGDARFSHLYTHKKKIFHRRAWQTHLIQHSFIENKDGSLTAAAKLPTSLITCTEAAVKYGITRKAVYEQIEGKATKYVVYGLKKYSEKEIELLLVDMI
ncbi:hypothetical protein DUK53_16775 [Listeria sp. SHR_NRA_18]|uniref:hypothetical protein n=1 Tax=Listeria sp. SHR_NRA_18 TaxID=2269046 RepID=UPI000F5E12F5|nr:hypothetical protein [Listeria sp. SHR_NRA_18]RQW65357.1 hypothetical protein DUK53_16775 [Listeria sp. SHR_NRA_18]